MSTAATPTDMMPSPGATACFGCGYSLTGIDPTQVCPECGLPVARSMGEDVLVKSPVEYVKKLHQGVVMILAGIILAILMNFLIFGLSFAGYGQASLLGSLLGLGVAILGAAGWWFFSEPDVRVQQHRGETARRLVRIAVAVQAGVAILNLTLSMLSGAYSAATSGASSEPTLWLLLLGIVGVASIGAGILQFFASMIYLRWLAPRLPDDRVFKRAKLLMWLGPVLMTVGLIIIIGPLIALILYYNLLNWVRIDLKKILGEQGIA